MCFIGFDSGVRVYVLCTFGHKYRRNDCSRSSPLSGTRERHTPYLFHTIRGRYLIMSRYFLLTVRLGTVLYLPGTSVTRCVSFGLGLPGYDMLRGVSYEVLSVRSFVFRLLTHGLRPHPHPYPSLTNYPRPKRKSHYLYKTLNYLHRQCVVTFIRFTVLIEKILSLKNEKTYF